MITYAAYYDNEVRMDSSSGGVFSCLATYFFSLKGVVYGVAMSDDCLSAEFRRAENQVQLECLRGSKYLQAKVNDTYKQVKRDLDDDIKVLFTGTACQINGLKAFLNKDYTNLLCVDVICHGASSPKYWLKYIEDKDVHSINFRAKDNGWENYTYGMKINNIYIPYTENKYMALYVRDYVSRPSCYKCIAKENKRSDITIGDFWGIEKIDCKMSDNKGTSLVICRSEKGVRIFDELKEQLVYKIVTYEEGVMQNPSEYKSASMPIRRNEFFRDMDNMDFDRLYKKYISVESIDKRIIRKVKEMVKKMIMKL